MDCTALIRVAFRLNIRVLNVCKMFIGYATHGCRCIVTYAAGYGHNGREIFRVRELETRIVPGRVCGVERRQEHDFEPSHVLHQPKGL